MSKEKRRELIRIVTTQAELNRLEGFYKDCEESEDVIKLYSREINLLKQKIKKLLKHVTKEDFEEHKEYLEEFMGVKFFPVQKNFWGDLMDKIPDETGPLWNQENGELLAESIAMSMSREDLEIYVSEHLSKEYRNDYIKFIRAWEEWNSSLKEKK